MTAPPHGVIHPRFGPFVRTAQLVSPGIWLCETVDGLTGKGRVTRPRLITDNPLAGKLNMLGQPEPDFIEFAVIKPATMRYRKGQSKVLMYRYRVTSSQPGNFLEAFFPTEADAIKFMIAAGPLFWSN